MSEGISATAEIFSSFRTKHRNIGLRSRENSNLRYRKNKQKNTYIEWRCFLDKSHKCKAKFFTNINLKECWNLKLDHICGLDLLEEQQTQISNLKSKIKGKTPTQKSKALSGLNRRQEPQEHSRSQTSNYNVQGLSKREKKHIEKMLNFPKNAEDIEIDIKEPQKGGIQCFEEIQKYIFEQSHIKDINASRMQILTQNSNQSPYPQLCHQMNAQSSDSYDLKHKSNTTNDNEQGDDQSRSDFIKFQKYSNQNRCELQRLTLALNLAQSQQPTRENSNTDVQNFSEQSMISIPTADHNPERSLKFSDDYIDVHNQTLNRQYLIGPVAKNDFTFRLLKTFSGALDQSNDGLQRECTYFTTDVLKRQSLNDAFQNKEEDSVTNELSIDDFLKGDDSSSDSYDSYDYGLRHNFRNTTNVEEQALFSQRGCQQ